MNTEFDQRSQLDCPSEMPDLAVKLNPAHDLENEREKKRNKEINVCARNGHMQPRHEELCSIVESELLLEKWALSRISSSMLQRIAEIQEF